MRHSWKPNFVVDFLQALFYIGLFSDDASWRTLIMNLVLNFKITKPSLAKIKAVLFNRWRERVQLRSLKKSARLYAEVYAVDAETRTLTEIAISEWPD